MVLDSIQRIFSESKGEIQNSLIKKSYEDLIERQKIIFKSKSFLFDTLFYPKVNEILQNLKQNNPEITEFNHVLINRSRTANAYCFGNGLIVVNLGLISLIQNENQLAALLAHELSHHKLKHMERGIVYHENFENDKENKKRLRKISRSEYERNERIAEFELDYAMSYRAESRNYETEADSMAAEIIKKSKYDLTGVIELLNILDNVEDEKYDYQIDYNSHFSNLNYDFNEDLLINSEGLLLQKDENKVIREALKTHPDCDFRKSLILKTFKVDTNQLFQIKQAEYKNFGRISDIEMLYHDIENKRYALCLKNALLLREEYDVSALNVLISNCLAKIYLAQKNHVLWDFLPYPKETYRLNYYQLLVIVENIRLSELKKLTENYIQSTLLQLNEENEDLNGYVAYLKLQQLCIQENRNPEKAEIKEIKEKFPLNSFINN